VDRHLGEMIILLEASPLREVFRLLEGTACEYPQPVGRSLILRQAIDIFLLKIWRFRRNLGRRVLTFRPAG